MRRHQLELPLGSGIDRPMTVTSYGHYGRPVDAWETHPTGSLPSTVRFAEMLAAKQIRCELDLWGYEVSHDWEWWQRQLAHHLPRFC
jgi:esterase/lipase superfamily enzyme